MLALLARWLDKESAAKWMAVLARWVDNESGAGLTLVLGYWRDFESASELTAVLANRRDVKLAAELTTGLLAACWCDDEPAVGRMAVLALLARWLDKESAARQMMGSLSELTTSRRRG